MGWEQCWGRREHPRDWWEVVVPLAVIGGWEVCCDWGEAGVLCCDWWECCSSPPRPLP